MSRFHTIILAAGKGVRMKSDIPKVLHPLCGKPLIQYTLDIAKELGSLKTYVVIGHKGDLVKSFLGAGATTLTQKRLLGTADAVKTAASYFRRSNDDVLVLCGDTPLLNKETLKNLIKKHKDSKAVCTFLTACLENPCGFGRIIRQDDRVLAIREEQDAAPKEKEIQEVNIGVYCFQSRPLFEGIKAIKADNKKKEFYLTDIIGLLAEKNASIETLQTQDLAEARGINTREDLAIAESLVRQRILKNHMSQGVTITDPATTYIAHNVKIGRDTTIRPYTVIEKDVRIGRGCTIGPFCRIRPQSVIGNQVEAGNFTEISRSQIGDHCFMKHFSFLGDARLGRRVNIGAGVVTANFDGRRKNTTEILDDAFIGSDSILIAPLKIGRKVVTAAGSVVTKGQRIPDRSVVMGVPAKITSGGKRL